ncbi:RND superfamily multidrug efflux pump acriflavin resistance protein [Gluconobacter thailandicus F149-1 = NBRC 100600]|uniref:Transport transmembrane protein n=1 Tax=Gluconobacter thailandicus NBRC 3257 TaxID=1381097 RepID=A0ABQ0ITG8_GLUTH|nr:efflux RND transporter permease subunit [Gluconobacter thailandicus]KXV33545.1 RND transporter [Gluconobacter thailandicus]KXV52256.1 RND transporter [Gluconobacter thailandicus]GAC87527.1 transport transmembrane protein [Gluconobacter thailandicus NBRC 3255]GAD25513.1 transport transmembrane protein [Gluconobacter thailandicus NBRC 3257]GAN92175.1 RND superfamily multidrug efflux pump acriflavin resistance protein [Gluconobacter thailandicus F149-1 = NBRC 100600]
MNAIVVTALKRPYTFVVLSIMILIFGVKAIVSTPTDVFPSIKIPIVAIVWSYTGLMPEDMSGRIVYYYERSLTATVSNIEHIESSSYYGRGIVKVFFQPGTNTAVAQTQITSVSQTVIKQLPTGATPPLIIALDASSVPVLTLQVNNSTMSGSEIYNMASNLIRPALVPVAGAAIPNPYGGLAPDIMVDIDPIKLLAHRLSPEDVANALNRQNIVLPAGDQKVGAIDWMVKTNSTPLDLSVFNKMPIKQVGNSVIYLRDVAWVHRGGPPQINAVLVKGQQAVLIVILKSGDASTLSVVAGVKALLPQIKATLPAGTTLNILTDASGFVKESVFDVVREMITAAILTSLTVLLFLGSWRSTVIVATSIPLAMLSSMIGLSIAGQSINVMTLGGLALAVGILVDDATVMIENIDAHLEMGKELEEAIIDASNQIVVPTFVSTTCICIVWLPLFELTGVSGWLFMPMAEAIIFAMIASFILSRTLVPTMANWLLPAQVKMHRDPEWHHRKPGFFGRFQRGFESRFTSFREHYKGILSGLIAIRGRFVTMFLLAAVASMALLLFVGQDFFPEIKSGTIQMHMRAPVGTRIEETGKIAGLAEKRLRSILPGQVENVVNNCGLPFSQLNQAMVPSPTTGAQDCDITIQLKNDESPIPEYRQKIRKGLTDAFPGTIFTFQPGDMTAKILNFGLPSPIDVQISGRDLQANFNFAARLAKKLRHIPGIADVSVQQPMTQPTLMVNNRRSFALGTGITQQDVALNSLVTLSGSAQVGQTYYLNAEGTSQLIDVQTPANYLQTMNDLEIVPIDKGDGNPTNQTPQLLGALTEIVQTGTPAEVSHYNIMPVFDIYAAPEGTDLGTLSRTVNRIVDGERKNLPHGSTLAVRGQAVTMNDAYVQLIGGLALSIALVYLIIVVNFQSWLDPFVIITALPGALGGISWSLFLTHTALSVPALTGAIMCMGTATANAILVVSFARERLDHHGDVLLAALEAGYERIRPVLMTALAMMIGMIPMSISNSSNAPLGKAVIGGLLVATIATLLFVPCVFALIHYKRPAGPEGDRA